MRGLSGKQIRRLSGEAFWVAFGMGLSSLAAFVGVRLLTGVMAPSEYGRLGLAMSLAMTLRYSLGTALRMGTARFYSVAETRNAFGWYWTTLRRLSLHIGLGTFLISFLLFAVWAMFSNRGNAWIYSMSLLTGGLIVLSGIGGGIQAGGRRRRAVCWNQNLFQWGRFLFAFLFASLFSGSARNAVAGFLVAVLLMLLSQYLFVRKELFPLIRRETASDTESSREFFSYLWPLLISGVFIWLQLFSIRWAIRWFGSLEQVGGYFAYYQIGFMPSLVAGGFLITFLNPIFFSHAGDGTDRRAQHRVRTLNGWIAIVMMAVVLIASLSVFMLNPLLARLLVSPAYRQDVWMLPWLVLSGGFYSVARQFLVSIYSGMASAKMIPVSIAGGLMSLGFHCAGGWLYGVPGIIAGGVLFSAVFMMMAWGLHAAEMRAGSLVQGLEGEERDAASFC